MIKKVFHYFYCFFCIVCRQLAKIFSYIQYVANRTIAILNCYRCYRQSKKYTNTSVKLQDVYPDTGKLGDYLPKVTDNQNKDLSIIVPMYNVEQYIEECLQSVLNQETTYSFEVLLINDGSTDQTMKKVEPFLSNPYVKIKQQANKGQSAARNTAITESDGKYIMFLDADDILLPNAVDTLLNAAIDTNSDIAEGKIARFSGTQNVLLQRNNKRRGKVNIQSYAQNPNFVLTTYGYSVAKVYRRDLWRTLRFPEGYIFEDIISKFILRRKANQVAFIDMPVYGYRYNINSSSHNDNFMKKLDSIWVLPRVIELCEQENVPRDETFYLLALNHIGLLNRITSKPLAEDIQRSCFAEMRKQLLTIQDARPTKIPAFFQLLEISILNNDFDLWQLVADTIQQYGLLKRWREIN